MRKRLQPTLDLRELAAAGALAAGAPARRAAPAALAERLGRFGLHDVDAALEVRAVLDDDARRADVPDQFGILADLNLVRGLHVALDGAQRHHFARLDGRAHGPVRPDRQLVLQGFHGAFHFAIDVQVFAAENLANHFHGLPDGGRTSARLRLESGRGHAGHG